MLYMIITKGGSMKEAGRGVELIVVGGGIGGSAAALRAAQYRLPTIWITGDRKTHRASRAAYVKNIDNMIGVHPGIMQAKIVDLLKETHPEAAERVAGEHFQISTQDIIDNARARIEEDFADAVRIDDRRAEAAEAVDTGFRVTVTGGDIHEAGALILSTGVMDRQPVVHREVRGRVIPDIHWVYPYANQETLLYCIRCEGHLTIGRTVGVIGWGDSSAEVALMIRERYGSEVTVLTAGERPAWSAERGRLLKLFGVRVVEGRLVDILGRDRGATLQGFVVEGGETVPVDLAFVCIGLHRVYNDLARQLGARLEERGESDDVRHVLVDARGETSVPGLFAVGDMTAREGEPMMKQIYTAQEYAVRAVDTIDRRRRMRDRGGRTPPAEDGKE
jgi:thioredoxin reductase (NADPH)